MSSEALDGRSVYERTFGTRYRGSGRPKGRDGVDWRLFPSDGLPAVISDVARRRAYAVVHEEQRKRLSEVFASEVAVLQDRGEDVVAADARRTVKTSSDTPDAEPKGADDGPQA